MQRDESLIKFLDRISGIVDKLADIGNIIPQSEICYLVLTSIPEHYAPITMSLRSTTTKIIGPTNETAPAKREGEVLKINNNDELTNVKLNNVLFVQKLK